MNPIWGSLRITEAGGRDAHACISDQEGNKGQLTKLGSHQPVWKRSVVSPEDASLP